MDVCWDNGIWFAILLAHIRPTNSTLVSFFIHINYIWQKLYIGKPHSTGQLARIVKPGLKLLLWVFSFFLKLFVNSHGLSRLENIQKFRKHLLIHNSYCNLTIICIPFLTVDKDSETQRFLALLYACLPPTRQPWHVMTQPPPK